MPRSLVLALVCQLALAAAAVAGDLEALDAQNGFRDAQFGAPFESFRGFALLSDRGARGSTLYVRPADELRFGKASLDGVTYGFYAGRLYFVTLFSSGARNGRAVLAELERAYGPGQRSASDADEYVWRGSRVLLHYRLDPATGMGMVALTGVQMDARVEADLAAALPAAAAE
jgi:hypothetical protein